MSAIRSLKSVTELFPFKVLRNVITGLLSWTYSIVNHFLNDGQGLYFGNSSKKLVKGLDFVFQWVR